MPWCGGVCTGFSSNAAADNDVLGVFARFLKEQSDAAESLLLLPLAFAALPMASS